MRVSKAREFSLRATIQFLSCAHEGSRSEQNVANSRRPRRKNSPVRTTPATSRMTTQRFRYLPPFERETTQVGRTLRARRSGSPPRTAARTEWRALPNMYRHFFVTVLVQRAGSSSLNTLGGACGGAIATGEKAANCCSPTLTRLILFCQPSLTPLGAGNLAARIRL